MLYNYVLDMNLGLRLPFSSVYVKMELNGIFQKKKNLFVLRKKW